MNPFEIRTQMLEMAKSYLEKQQEINTQFAKQAFDQLVVTGQCLQTEWKDYAPQMYNFDEITKKAKELYGFVNAK
jgi:hypothetical protein